MTRWSSISALALMCGGAGMAQAGFTAVNTSSPSDGVSVVNILARIYTGNFDTTVTGNVDGILNFGNGVTASRIADYGGSGATDVGSTTHLNLGGASTNDQIWQDGVVHLQARSRYAGYEQNFGFQTGATTSGPGFSNTALSIAAGFSDGGVGDDVSIGSAVDFRWMRADDSAGTTNVLTSRASDNGDVDQMIAFEIFGVNGGRRYVVFFEDIGAGEGDRDFNDLAMEIVAIPLPTGGGIAAASLGALALFRRRRTA